MQNTFPAETIRSLMIADIAGELVVRGWDERTVKVECDAHIATLRLEGETLIVGGAGDGVIISVPYETSIQAVRISDDVSIVNVSQAELHEVRSDCFLKSIHGEVSLGRIHGDLRVEDVRTLLLTEHVDKDASFIDIESLKATRIGGDVFCKNIHEALLLYGIGKDLNAENVDVLSVGHTGRGCVIRGNGQTIVKLANVGTDLTIHGVSKLQVKNVGRSCEVYESEQAEIVLGHIGSKLEIAGASSVQVHNVGQECKLRDIRGHITMRHIGANLQIAGVGGDLRLGNVGKQAEIRGVQGKVALGNIGAHLNLELSANFPPECINSLSVGGNAKIALPENANITVYAHAGARVKDEQSGVWYTNHAVLVYGDGTAQLKIKAGGNVFLYSPVIGRPMSEKNWDAQDWQDWGNWQDRQNWGDWQDWGDWQNWGNWQGWQSWGEGVASMFDQKERKRQQRAEAQNRRKQEQRRRAEERARATRFREREWWFDPARIDHLVDQARQAAADGIQGALEAVDQALRNMQLSVPPYPHPPHAPHPPMPPEPPVYPDAGPASPRFPPVYPDVPNDQNEGGEAGLEEPEREYAVQPDEANNAPVDIDQEREAILRMIAEGRLTVEEGDMLLEALS